MNRPSDNQIEKVLAGLATPEEAREVAKWFATDEGSAYISNNFDADINSIPLEDADLLIDHSVPSDKMFQKINSRIRSKLIRCWTFRAAAVLLPLVLILGLYLHLNTRVDIFGAGEYAEIYVPKGERMQMMFQDGTKVYINSDSYMRYPHKFGISERTVELKGEAYFVVAKNKNRPFVVNLNGPSIRVLGTSFNVEAYPENDDIKVNLDEGRINLKLLSDVEVPVSPGECVVYNKNTKSYRVNRNTDTGASSVWKSNVISFKDTPLDEVFSRLSRWYNVDFEVEDDIPSDLHITLVSRHTLIEKVLEDLVKISPLSFRYDEQSAKVYVSLKK